MRTCAEYKDEYKECTSIRDRFHQYFIFGELRDCRQWKVDYDDCRRFEEKEDWQAALNIIRSEKRRRDERFKAHYANTVWTKRSEPPAEWAKPLPEWIQKRDEHSYLAIKSKELKGEVDGDSDAKTKSLCVIM